MDNDERSKLRRGENEVIFRAHNTTVQRQADSVLPDADKASFPISFLCECSDEDCMERLEITTREFERIHKNPKRFVVKPGHCQADIEKIVERHDGYEVNEKFIIPPSPLSRLNETHHE